MILIKKAVKAARQERKDIYLNISSEFIEENQLYSKALLTSFLVHFKHLFRIICLFYNR